MPRRSNPVNEFRIVPDDSDPELVCGAVVIPVTKAAKVFIGRARKLIRLKEVYRGTRGGKAYWIPLEDAPRLAKLLQTLGYSVRIEGVLR